MDRNAPRTRPDASRTTYDAPRGDTGSPSPTTMDRRSLLGLCGTAAAGFCALGLTGSLAACGDTSDDDASRRASEGAAYYAAHKDEYLRMCEGVADALEGMMKPEYGATTARAIATSTVARYRELLPELPYIGGRRNPMTGILYRCGVSLAYCLAVTGHGRPVDDAGRFNYQMYVDFPYSHGDGATRPTASPDPAAERRGNREWCAWTQQRAYPGDWVAEYVGGLSAPYTYGFDMTECAVLRLCRHFGIPGFAPYLCLPDKPKYEAEGKGMTRTTTLADGFDCCDFRFRDDGVVRLGEPFSARTLREWGVVQPRI